MKRTILLAFLLLTVRMVWAGVVPEASALKMAQAFLGCKAGLVYDDSVSGKVASRDADTPLYYIIQSDAGTGWVIMAADDRVNPILAYSDKGRISISDMPDNMKLWMEDMADGIRKICNGRSQADRQVTALWNALENGNVSTRAGMSGCYVLSSAEWGQNAPFNSCCPYMPGEAERSSAGCMATAMGIVMQYYKWPSQGNGVIGGYYTSDSGVYIAPYSISEKSYSWKDMPGDNRNSLDSIQIRSIASLLHDCGVMAKTDYSCQGSSAILSIACAAMIENMSFSKSLRLVNRSVETASSWYDSIVSEIDANRLVIIGAVGEKGGHAMVCDGYDSNGDMLHINWGWDGVNNGFYSLDLSITGYSTFNIAQTAVIHLYPAWMGGSESVDACHFVSQYSNGNDALKVNTMNPLSKGATADISIGFLGTTSIRDEFVSVRLVLEDTVGNMKQELAVRTGMTMQPDAMYSFYETVRLDVEPEMDDRIVLYAKTRDTEWEKVHADFHSYPDLEYVSCGTTPLPFIAVGGLPAQGELLTLSLAGGYSPWKSVVWQLDGSTLEGTTFVMPAGSVKISAVISYPDGSTVNVIRKLAVNR